MSIMAYLVLARKWRPQTFNEVVGQPHIVRTLQNAIKTNRVSHALVFCGPRGVGKTTVARILAKALNCEKGPSPEPCNKCIICKEITSGLSLDVQEIDAASNRGIDEVREIRENVKYLPARGRYKVYIIDEVHMLTKEAFNALLKTLEEPPSHVIFVFATTEPHKIPATILSRCQRFPFRRIGTRLIFERLKVIAAEEKITIKDSAIWLIARAATGSLRDALSLLDQVVSFTDPPIDVEHVQAILGLFDSSIIMEAIEAVLKQNVKKAMAIINRICEEGEDLREFYYQLLTYWRYMLFLKLNQESLIDVSEDERAMLKRLSEYYSLTKLEQLFMILLSEEGTLRFTAQPRFVLEALFLKMAEFNRIVPIEVIIEKLSSISTPVVKKAIIEETVESEDIALKERVFKILKRESPILAIVMESAKMDLKNSTLYVNLSKEHARLFEDKDLWKVFKKVCHESIGTCEIVIKTDNREHIPQDEGQFDLLKEVLKTFGGEIIKNRGKL